MEELDIAVVGGGPAGLRAAEVAAGMGRRVVVFD
ncbi:MAG: NAD(P)/FAD-dependent oxidoreductase, partial [Luteolibacter sp.]